MTLNSAKLVKQRRDSVAARAAWMRRRTFGSGCRIRDAQVFFRESNIMKI